MLNPHSNHTDLTLAERVRLGAMYVLPHHALCALMHAATRVRWAPYKNRQIRWFIRRYGVDMVSPVEQNPENYKDFNTFFTRALKPSARPICHGDTTVVAPADGVVSEAGRVATGMLTQVKGIHYSLRQLLGDAALAAQFEGGAYATIYLSPRDYHRVHMPVSGHLKAVRHFPGRLFSVNALSTRCVTNLFVRNERVVSVYETDLGLLAMVLVGAVFVGSIELVGFGTVTPRRLARQSLALQSDQLIPMSKGTEMGRFNMGSTVVMVLANRNVQWQGPAEQRASVHMGQQIASITTPSTQRINTQSHQRARVDPQQHDD